MNAMLLLAALPFVAAPTALARAPVPSTSSSLAAPRAGCDDLRPRLAERAPPVRPGVGDPSRTIRPRTLDELPPGRLEHTVLREVDGCPIPAVLREGIGAAPAPERR